MRLYPKKLRNIEDLEREKKLLLKESRQLDEDDFLTLEGLMGKGKEAGGAASLVDMLPITNPMVSKVVKMLVSRLTKKDKAPKAKYKEEATAEKPGNSLLKKAAIEFIGGYLKWKAIELSYKGIKRIIQKRKESANKIVV